MNRERINGPNERCVASTYLYLQVSNSTRYLGFKQLQVTERFRHHQVGVEGSKDSTLGASPSGLMTVLSKATTLFEKKLTTNKV
jgi:hypothetical protein